jgi:hypothetical protein
MRPHFRKTYWNLLSILVSECRISEQTVSLHDGMRSTDEIYDETHNIQ